MNNLAKIQEQRLTEMHERQDRLIKVWSPYISAVENYLKEKHNKTIGIVEKRTIAQCLDNAMIQDMIMKQQNSMLGLNEATQMSNISFLGIQLPVIAALLPSLVLNKISTVQALDRRQGAVFYLDVKYGTNKGLVSSGDTMIGSKTGRARDNDSQRMYASEWVYDELIANSQGTTSALTGTVAYAPGVDITNFAVTVKDSSGTTLGASTPGSGNITGTGISGTGTITSAGVYNITPAVADSDGIYITYRYQYDQPAIGDGTSTTKSFTGVPEVNIDLTSELINAINFPLKAKYSMGASIDLEKAHGINLESELVKYLGGDIKFTIDHYGIDMMIDASINGVGTSTPATAIGAWDATVQSGQEWLWKKNEFIDYLEKGSNAIFSKTLRGVGNFLIVGNNVARVIRQFGSDFFKPASGLDKSIPTGPIELGVFNDKLVVQDPFIDSGHYTMGFKGDNFLYSSFIYAPYIPMFATPTLLTSDLYAQKGFMSAAGFKIINPGLFTYGTITGTGLPAGA